MLWAYWGYLYYLSFRLSGIYMGIIINNLVFAVIYNLKIKKLKERK